MPGVQRLLVHRASAAVKCEFSARRCTDAQIFLSIHQEKGNYDVEAGDPLSLRYSSSQQPNFGPRTALDTSSTVDITSHIAGSAGHSSGSLPI